MFYTVPRLTLSPAQKSLLLLSVLVACRPSDEQRQTAASASRVGAFVQCVMAQQLSGNPNGPVTYEEWEQACKNSPTTAELSTYLARHSDTPSGVVSFLQKLAAREDERRAPSR